MDEKERAGTGPYGLPSKPGPYGPGGASGGGGHSAERPSVRKTERDELPPLLRESHAIKSNRTSNGPYGALYGVPRQEKPSKREETHRVPAQDEAPADTLPDEAVVSPRDESENGAAGREADPFVSDLRICESPEIVGRIERLEHGDPEIVPTFDVADPAERDPDSSFSQVRISGHIRTSDGKALHSKRDDPFGTMGTSQPDPFFRAPRDQPYHGSLASASQPEPSLSPDFESEPSLSVSDPLRSKEEPEEEPGLESLAAELRFPEPEAPKIVPSWGDCGYPKVTEDANDILKREPVLPAYPSAEDSSGPETIAAAEPELRRVEPDPVASGWDVFDDDGYEAAPEISERDESFDADVRETASGQERDEEDEDEEPEVKDSSDDEESEDEETQGEKPKRPSWLERRRAKKEAKKKAKSEAAEERKRKKAEEDERKKAARAIKKTKDEVPKGMEDQDAMDGSDAEERMDRKEKKKKEKKEKPPKPVKEKKEKKEKKPRSPRAPWGFGRFVRKLASWALLLSVLGGLGLGGWKVYSDPELRSLLTDVAKLKKKMEQLIAPMMKKVSESEPLKPIPLGQDEPTDPLDQNLLSDDVAPPPEEGAEEFDIESLAERVLPATVHVATNNGKVGIGFFVDGGGNFVTNYRTVEGATEIKAAPYGKTYSDVWVRAVDPERDMALLVIMDSLRNPYLRLSAREVGSEAMLLTMENSGVAEYTVSEGSSEGELALERPLLMYRASMSPALSAGPTVGSDGTVVGLSKWSDIFGGGVYFATAGRDLKAFVEENGKNYPKPIREMLPKPRVLKGTAAYPQQGKKNTTPVPHGSLPDDSGFRGVKWGSSLDESAKRFGTLAPAPREGDVFRMFEPKAEIGALKGGLRAKARYGFENGAFRVVVLEFADRIAQDRLLGLLGEVSSAFGNKPEDIGGTYFFWRSAFVDAMASYSAEDEYLELAFMSRGYLK